MSEFRRRLMMRVDSDPNALPAGCVRCEYLESTGTQWIDTECYPVIGDELNIDRLKSANINGTQTLFGAGSEDSQFVAVRNASGFFVRYFSGTAATISNDGQLSEYSLSVKKNGDIYVDGVRRGGSDPMYDDVNTTLAIFNRGNRAASYTGYIGTITITRDSEYVVNLVPCLDTDGRPCYYDTVNKKFHYNKGTGQFLYKILEQ